MSTDILRSNPSPILSSAKDKEIILQRSADVLRMEPTEKESSPRRRRIIHLLAILLPTILSGYVILGYLSFILGRA